MTAGARSILVVDDDEAVRSMMCIVLSVAGYSAEGAADGIEALQRLRTGEPPALIILDLMMPRMDGDAFMRAISADGSLTQIPIAILSGQMNPEVPIPGPQVVARIVKPIELDDLLDVVQRVAGPPADGPGGFNAGA